MSKIVFILVTSLLFFTGCKTQQDPAQKAAADSERAYWGEKAIQALNERKFVLEADRIDFKYGNFAYVSPSTNFISMNG